MSIISVSETAVYMPFSPVAGVLRAYLR